jgi:hypothetical protein
MCIACCAHEYVQGLSRAHPKGEEHLGFVEGASVLDITRVAKGQCDGGVVTDKYLTATSEISGHIYECRNVV